MIVHEVAAVAEDDADDRLHEQGHEDVQERGDLGKLHVRLLVLLVEPTEGHEPNGLLDERLDDRNARKVLLGEVRQSRERLLALVPLLLHGVTHHRTDGEQKAHGNEGKQGQGVVHAEHLDDGEHPEEQGVGEHEHARAEAVLHGFEVVRKVGHEGAHLIDLVVFAGEILATVEHTPAQVGLHLDARAEEADAPEETPDRHEYDDDDHGQADAIQQKIHVKGKEHAFADLHLTVVDAVDEHALQLGDLELKVVDDHQ